LGLIRDENKGRHLTPQKGGDMHLIKLKRYLFDKAMNFFISDYLSWEPIERFCLERQEFEEQMPENQVTKDKFSVQEKNREHVSIKS